MRDQEEDYMNPWSGMLMLSRARGLLTHPEVLVYLPALARPLLTFLTLKTTAGPSSSILIVGMSIARTLSTLIMGMSIARTLSTLITTIQLGPKYLDMPVSLGWFFVTRISEVDLFPSSSMKTVWQFPVWAATRSLAV